MNPKQNNRIAIVTTSLYNPNDPNSAFRIDLTRKTIKGAVEKNYHIIVADRSTDPCIGREFSQLGAEILVQEQGLGKSRRQVIKRAYDEGKEVIVWIEPEKYTLVHEMDKITGPIIEGVADLVIPRRKSLDSYPVFQQCAETFGNSFWKSLTGYDLDIWFGPRAFRRDIARYFLDYDVKLNYGDLWDSIFVPVIDLIRDEKRVLSVDVDFTYPREQTEIEEGNLTFYKKRLDQLNNLVPALEDHWRRRGKCLS